ncbi:MAG: (2Fe-2S)-binding protein [Betaproteobacteria bacterium]|nr:(2Fe-2S)-binding protein [Betaproteobacteria bacterium]
MNSNKPVVPGAVITVFVDGQPVQARRGQTLAAALLALGHSVLRRTRHSGKPRGLFCAMGICYDCVVTVNGETGVRACMKRVEDGMQVISPAQFKRYEPRK